MIVFTNDGLMPLEAATSFGINVKMGESPIGFFGTGLKYAIAVCLRLGGKFRLFLGEVEYEFYVKESDFRGKEFGFIHMKKRKGWNSRWTYQKLAYTTELGKHWEPWMAVREIESNTRDENGTSCILEGDQVPFIADNQTMIIIECPEMEDAYADLGSIFMPEKKLIQEIGPLQIFEGLSPYVFFRGLRVTDLSKPSLFTYNFNLGITLTEDRTSKWPWSDMSRIMECVMTGNNQHIIDTIMDAEPDTFYESEFPWDQAYVQPTATYVGALGYRISSGGTVPTRMKSWYDTMNAPDEVDKYLDVKLKRSQINELIDLMESYPRDGCEEVIAQLKKALPDTDEIGF